MEQTFYLDILFGSGGPTKTKRVQDKILETLSTKNDYRFQIHPFRTVMDGGGGGGHLRTNLEHHLAIMDDIGRSGIDNKKPFHNVIFVNYTTAELMPALRYERVRFYLCDFIDDTNIELVTLVAPSYVNFLGKIVFKQPLNTYFMNYNTLTFYDTDADRRIRQTTTLDIGEETEDDIAFIFEMTHIDGDRGNGGNDSDIILPYHPFRYSLFMSTQKAKDNISALVSQKHRNHHHLIYYPFGQSEWLLILRNIMYERVFLNFLVQSTLFEGERVRVRDGMFRNLASSNYTLFRRIERKYKLPILNESVFDYREVFKTRVYSGWYNSETRIQMHTPSFVAANIYVLRLNNGLFI